MTLQRNINILTDITGLILLVLISVFFIQGTKNVEIHLACTPSQISDETIQEKVYAEILKITKNESKTVKIFFDEKQRVLEGKTW